MANRLTVPRLKELANKMLATDTNSASYRAGIYSLAQVLLLDCNQFHGSSTIEWIENGYRKWSEAGCPPDKSEFVGDTTRQHFH